MNFILREWKNDDIKDVAAVANNEKIANNLRNAFPNPYTYEDAEFYVNSCINAGDEHQYTRAIVVDEKVVGSIGVFMGSDVYDLTGELGYWLAETHWGLGIMTDAVKQICKEVFDRYDIVRIYAEPFEHNSGSRRVLEKAGFNCEGIMKNGVHKNGKIFDYCMYALLAD